MGAFTRRSVQDIADDLEKMFNMDGEAVTVAQGNPIRVRIPLEGPVDGALIARLL